MAMVEYEYFIEHDLFGVKKVSLEEWISAERSAGFFPRGGVGPATGGFSGNGIRGFIRPKKPNSVPTVRLQNGAKTPRDMLTEEGVL